MTDNSILLEPSLKPREGWEADFQRCHGPGDDDPLTPGSLDAEFRDGRLDQISSIMKTTLRDFLLEFCIEAGSADAKPCCSTTRSGDLV